MKLLVLGINYDPELTGIAVYNTEMCDYLAKKGHEVTILTGFPYYPFGMDFSSWYSARKLQSPLFLREIINGVQVVRVNLLKPKKISTLKRILHELSFCFFACLRLLFLSGKYEAMVCVSPPLLLGLVAYGASRLRRISFVFHVQDLQPDAAIELGMIKKGFGVKVLYALERFIYRKADFVTTVSQGMREKIIAKGFDAKKVRLLYNWASLEEAAPALRRSVLLEQHGLEKKFIVLHAGNMGQKQDMRVILEAARLLKEDSSILFLLIGRGAKRATVEAYIKEQALRNVLLLDVQPKGVISAIFSCANVALITQEKDVKNIVMPSKVFGPALTGRPLIVAASSECEISKLAQDHHFGLVIEPENASALVEAIKRIKDDKVLAEEMGKSGRLFMQQERNIKTILDGFEQEVLTPCVNKVRAF
jgi:colanic acid biosynthesis glycosyl transferase WcaI